MLRALGILLLVVIFCLAVALGYFNLTPVQFDYLFGTAQLHLVVLLLLAFAAGIVLTLLLSSWRMLRLRTRIRRLKRQLNVAESERVNLQALPVDGS